MNPSRKRKVIGKCQVTGCVVSEKRCPGIDAFHCKCQCGNTWYKSLCGKHEISSFNDMQRMLSKQQTKDNGTENKDAPTTRIEQNKKCSNCTSTNVVEPSTITVRSHCILQYKCECKHEWFTDQSGKTKRGRRDKLINKLNTDMSPVSPNQLPTKIGKYINVGNARSPSPAELYMNTIVFNVYKSNAQHVVLTIIRAQAAIAAVQRRGVALFNI